MEEMNLKKGVGIKSSLVFHAKDLDGQVLDFILETTASQFHILKNFDTAVLITSPLDVFTLKYF